VTADQNMNVDHHKLYIAAVRTWHFSSYQGKCADCRTICNWGMDSVW